MARFEKRTALLFTFLVSIGTALAKPAEDKAAGVPLAEEPIDKEAFGRFLLTQVGTMMCYRTWEINPSIDFHNCNVCFNNTNQPEVALPKGQHTKLTESCYDQYLKNTDYEMCRPMLKDPSIPNKKYDILVTEPPFDFAYKNFARCAHGVVFKQETEKCVAATDTVKGVEPFLDRFSCLMINLVEESKKFSEANRKELLGSVPA